MKHLFKALLAGLVTTCVMMFGQAYAQTVHTITISVDSSTAGDIKLVEGFLDTAADETSVSQSLRRITMAAVGEVSLAVNARIDDYDLLTLDDGSTAAVFEVDSIDVAIKDPDGVAFGPIFKCGFKKKVHGGCQPLFVVNARGTMAIPPVKKKPPIIKL